MRSLGANLPAAKLISLRFIRQPEAGKRHAGETDAESLQRRATCDRLGHVFCEFIEMIVHMFPFVWPRLMLLPLKYFGTATRTTSAGKPAGKIVV